MIYYNMMIFKSHSTLEDILSGRISVGDFLGNQYADSMARRGADLWQLPEEMVQAINFTRGRAWKIGLRLAAVTVDTVKAYGASPTLAPARRAAARLPPKQLVTKLEGEGHHILFEGPRFVCTLCGISGVHCRAHVLKVMSRGACRRVLLQEDHGEDSGQCTEVPVASGDVEGELDPFDLGNMDLDRNFSNEATPVIAPVEPVVGEIRSS